MARPFRYTAQEITEIFEKYKEYNKTQYFERPELIKSGERAGEVIYVKVYSPLMIKGFCLFAGMTEANFYELMKVDREKDSEQAQELFESITRVHTEICNSQIAGATVNVYNPVVVSRLNGLKDSQEVEVSGKTTDINIHVNGKDIDITSD